MLTRVAIAALLIGISTLPDAVDAKGATKVSRVPDILDSKNSQTMDLLQGFLNTNPTGVGGAEIAIVDDSAIEYAGQDDGAFIDGGPSGTGQISVYVVRKGDTLASIAKMFGVSPNTITWANEVKGGKVTEGQELVILPISGVRHTVKSGDTLQSIAKKYKADLEEILEYNNLTPGSKIAAGDVVIVPDGVLSSTPLQPKPGVGGSKYPTYSGFYMRPLSGGKKSQGIHGYNGIDIAASVGTPVMASAGGKVIISRSGYNGGYGNYVVVSHSNGTQTLYAHLSRINVSTGQTVEQGQLIGAVGNTGRSTGPHLHFEVRGAKNPF